MYRRSAPLRILYAGAALGAALVPPLVTAQEYPSKPVRWVVPYAPGGGGDTIGRPLTQKLGEILGKPMVMDNRPGAGGTLGSNLVAKSAPDGYTLLLTLGGITIGPAIYPQLPYDPVKDFAPVILISRSSYVLSVHPSVPAKSVAELLALAKAKPGTLNYSSNGVGTDQHMAAELFKSMARVDLLHVPFNGTGPAVTSLLGGQTQIMFLPVTIALPHINAGKVRALAVSTAKRSAEVLPELPTIAEAGVPGFESDAWWCVLAPAATPRAIVGRLNRELRQLIHTPEMRKYLTERLNEPVGSTPAELGMQMQRDATKWLRVAKEANIRGE
jgi:tripartite-type tricarboxylate transporter receptor subunit TctC